MEHSTISKYPLEFRNQMAKECYELLGKKETTVTEFAATRNISRKCLYNWINVRYNKSQNSSSPSFVKIEKAPVTVAIDYYGASIQTTDVNLVQVLAAIRKAATI